VLLVDGTTVEDGKNVFWVAPSHRCILGGSRHFEQYDVPLGRPWDALGRHILPEIAKEHVVEALANWVFFESIT